MHTTIDKSFFRDFVLYFGITEIQTDVGLFEEIIKRENYMNFIKTTQAFYNRDEKFFYEGESMCEIQFQLGDDIRIQKRSFMKMTEVFATTGGYMQLIATLFKIMTFLINKLNYELKMVNSLFNIYQEKKEIMLKNKYQKIMNNNKKGFTLYRNKKNSFSPISGNYIIKGMDNNINRLNLNDYFIHSINLDNKMNNFNEITESQKNKINISEDIKYKSDDKSKESSIISDNKNK